MLSLDARSEFGNNKVFFMKKISILYTRLSSSVMLAGWNSLVSETSNRWNWLLSL